MARGAPQLREARRTAELVARLKAGGFWEPFGRQMRDLHGKTRMCLQLIETRILYSKSMLLKYTGKHGIHA